MHGKECRCCYQDENGNFCKNSIYFYIYKSGARYCEKHLCRFPRCRSCIDNKEYGLCQAHYNSIVFCSYIDDNKKKCMNIVEQKNIQEEKCDIFESLFDLFDSMAFLDITTSEKPIKFCDQHKCIVLDCDNRRINDKTFWCFKHSKRCDFINIKGERCDNYLFYKYDEIKYLEQMKKLNKELMNINQENNEETDELQCDIYLCSKHKCSWYKKDCNNSIDPNNEHVPYCKDHYQLDLFYQNEYVKR
jgi:hypothetical protein